MAEQLPAFVAQGIAHVADPMGIAGAAARHGLGRVVVLPVIAFAEVDLASALSCFPHGFSAIEKSAANAYPIMVLTIYLSIITPPINKIFAQAAALPEYAAFHGLCHSKGINFPGNSQSNTRPTTGMYPMTVLIWRSISPAGYNLRASSLDNSMLHPVA